MDASNKVKQLYEGILNKNLNALAKSISLVESSRNEDKQDAKQLISLILPHTGKAKRIGISGTPGAGKSTFIESFGTHLTQQNSSVAVLAVDPSSSLSKGSILGDKTRMVELSKSSLAFIRPSPSRGYYGGVAISTYESILICEAYGFDNILIETVGVGQSEIMVKDMVDFFLLVAVSGGGDELQGMKRGIMEIADMVFINKVDEQANQADIQFLTDLKRALPLFPDAVKDWQKPVIMGSALHHKNINEVDDLVNDFFELTINNGYLHHKRENQNEQRFKQLLRQSVIDQYFENVKNKEHYSQLLQEVRKGTIFSLNAVDQLLQNIG